MLEHLLREVLGQQRNQEDRKDPKLVTMSTSKRVCVEMVSSPEDVMQLNKKGVCDQLRLCGLAAPTRLTVSELRERLVKFLNRPTVG